MKREISFMLLLYVMGLANIGFNIFSYWDIGEDSDAITKNGDLYEATGKLTGKDLSKGIIITFTFNGTDISPVFKGNLKICPDEYHLTCKGTPVEIPVSLNLLDPILNSHQRSNDLAELAPMNEFLDRTDLGQDFKRKFHGSIQTKRFTDSK